MTRPSSPFPAVAFGAFLIAACAGGSGSRGATDASLGTDTGTTGSRGLSTGTATVTATSTTTGSSGGTTSGPATSGTGSPSCGDGVIEGNEECDDGSANADNATCTSACKKAVCGDGLVLDSIESCDDGNLDDTDSCTRLCAPPSCTDQIVSGDESDVDCGGSCPPCVAGDKCNDASDCDGVACVMGLCEPAHSCAELLGLEPGVDDGLYTIDPNGGDLADAVTVYCDMSTDGGGWTALAANGDISIPETTDPGDCYPLVTGDAGAGCGDPSDLMSDFTLRGDQQSALSWRYMMGIAYGDGGYSQKLAFFAIDFGGSQPTTSERFNGNAYVPTGITTIYGQMACTGHSIVHYTEAGTYNNVATYLANGKGTVFGHDNVITMNDVARLTFGFTDAVDNGATQSGTGIDDYQDGWSCGDSWVPQAVRGARMVVLVR